jgi:hypothetical protein
VVSSFGKRKYTKGYFFNFISHKKSPAALISSIKTAKSSGEKSVENINPYNSLILSPDISEHQNNVPFASQTSATVDQRKKVSAPAFTQTENSKAPLKKNFLNFFSEPPGVPGHGATDSTQNTSKDTIAKASLICALLSVLLLFIITLFPFLLPSLSFFVGLLVISAFIMAIIGLKSKKYHGMALAALIISSILLFIALIGAIVLIIVLLSAI